MTQQEMASMAFYVNLLSDPEVRNRIDTVEKSRSQAANCRQHCSGGIAFAHADAS